MCIAFMKMVNNLLFAFNKGFFTGSRNPPMPRVSRLTHTGPHTYTSQYSEKTMPAAAVRRLCLLPQWQTIAVLVAMTDGLPARCLLDDGASSLLAVCWTLVRVPCSLSSGRWCEFPARRLLYAGASSLLAVCWTLVRAPCSPSAGRWCELPARRLLDTGASSLLAVLGCRCALPMDVGSRPLRAVCWTLVRAICALSLGAGAHSLRAACSTLGRTDFCALWVPLRVTPAPCCCEEDLVPYRLPSFNSCECSEFCSLFDVVILTDFWCSIVIMIVITLF